jgi:alcohol dehydrogenase class IV
MNDIADFDFARIPEIHFGAGKLDRLPQLIGQKGRRIILVSGAASFARSIHHERLTQALTRAEIDFFQVSVCGEPSPSLIDQAVGRYRDEKIDWVVAIGGGSAIDAGKAISAMLPQPGSASDYLEGMATRSHDGRKVPFVAIPTSSGTGAEATKNAVLSEIGSHGYKRSLRHDNLVPEMALIDPQLMLSCPPQITAACGLDALTQLLEAYVSSQASAITDVLARSGLEHLRAGFVPAFERGDTDLCARSHMAHAALLSGMALANAGLGVVHGFAAPIGGHCQMPHGEACGTLLGEATRINIEAMFEDVERYRTALEKYADAGALLSGQPASTLRNDCGRLLRTLEQWIELTRIPRLGKYGITAANLSGILDRSNNKNSPVTLDRQQMASILEARL